MFNINVFIFILERTTHVFERTKMCIDSFSAQRDLILILPTIQATDRIVVLYFHFLLIFTITIE